jgi:hypothetical protein
MRFKHLFILIFLVITLIKGGFALENGVCVNAQISKIEPVSINPGDDFIVGIEIDNCGTDLPNQINFEITKFGDDISINDPLNNSISQLGFANSNRFLTFHMHAAQDAFPGEHQILAKLTYSGGNMDIVKEYDFSIYIKSEKPKLTVSGIRTSPEKVYPGSDLILTIKIQNGGNGDAKSVRVKID